MSAATAAAKSSSGRCSQDRIRAGRPAARSSRASSIVQTPSQVAPACKRGPGDGDGAVPVAVRLDHRHQRGAGGRGAQHVDVVPDGGEIDERLGARAVHPRILSSATR